MSDPTMMLLSHQANPYFIFPIISAAIAGAFIVGLSIQQAKIAELNEQSAARPGMPLLSDENLRSQLHQAVTSLAEARRTIAALEADLLAGPPRQGPATNLLWFEDTAALSYRSPLTTGKNSTGNAAD